MMRVGKSGFGGSQCINVNVCVCVCGVDSYRMVAVPAQP